MEVLEDLFVQVAGPLVVAALLWASGIPKRVVSGLATLVGARRLERMLRQGPFDSGTITRAVTFYVWPKCSNTDPSIEQEPINALVTPRESLFRVLDRFLTQAPTNKKHLMLLADSGMGKTSFFLNYFYERRSRLRGRRNIQLISLAQKNCDAIVEAIPVSQQREIDLFLDALDEDQRAIGRVRERIAELVDLCQEFRSVVISCRTQFFGSDDEIPVATGVFKIAPVPANESKEYLFRRLYLSPFDDEQITQYLKKRYPGLLRLGDRRQAKAIVAQVPALSVRPMLLAHLPDILRAKAVIRQPIDVYEAMVGAWLVRESAWVDPAKLRSFSERLAIDLYFNSATRGYESAMPEEIAALAAEWHVHLDPVHLTSRSLLNRTSDGRYKFSHRSIMEYFLSDFLVYGNIDEPVKITDQMAQFIAQRLGCWSGEVARMFSYHPVDVEQVEPELSLGYATDFGLFGLDERTINARQLMEIPVLSYGDRQARTSLGEVISHCAEVANQKNAGGVQRVVLRFPAVKSMSRTSCHCSVWFKSTAILVSLEVEVASLAKTVQSQGADFASLTSNDFMISAFEAAGSLKWQIRRRVILPDVVKAGVSLSSQLSANPAVSFVQGDGESIRVFFLKRFLNRSGEFSRFGILSDVDPRDLGDGKLLILPSFARGREPAIRRVG